MYISRSSLTLFGLAAPALINASPLIVSLPNLECAAVNFVVGSLKAYPSATPFCSSFLHIPTVTLSATSTITSPVTSTNTITAAAVTISASAVTSTVEIDSTTITTCTSSNTPNAVAARNFPIQTSSSTKSSTMSSTHSTTPSSILNTAQRTTSSATQQTGLPSCVASFQSSQISTACSCLSITAASTTTTTTVTATPIVSTAATVTPTTTVTPPVVDVTVTSTATVASCAPAESSAPALCNNQGLQWAAYSNPFPPNSDNTYSPFDPTYFKSDTPEEQGVTTAIGGIDYQTDGEITIYDSTQQISSQYFALNHRGYVFAQQTGVYTFSFSACDDIAFLWIGDNAHSAWDRDDANLVASEIQGVSPGSGSVALPFVAGQYYPIRILFGQAAGPAAFEVSVTAPDGSTFLSSGTTGSPYIIQYSCDETAAPPYPAFGGET